VITDPLTGAYNRHYFNTRTGKLSEQLNRHDHPASMIMFDIDHFKAINDNYGHPVGDRVLRILVDTVKARIRVVDEIFRLGGEEFVILLPDTLMDQAAGLAQVITDMVSDVRIIEGGRVSISCGVAELGKEEDTRSWLRRTDSALYNAKRTGRGRVCVAEPYDPEREPTLVREPVAPMTFNAG
jgi:diguanylate cyclase (GGDEF)-like protein